MGNIRKIEQRITKLFRKALTDYHLIADGDHVLVAVSGGKDSLLLLELLAKRSRIFKPKFCVTAVHVRMENITYETDTTYLEHFCSELQVPLHIVTTRFDSSSVFSLAVDQPNTTSTSSCHQTKSPCFLCSWYRRKELFRVAQQLGCNKIALGHHQDDIIHTALMNLTYEGRFEGMPVFLQLENMPLSIIRPLALQHEDDIVAYAEEHKYLKLLKMCPYESVTKRTNIAQLFRKMQQLNPEARYSIWHALKGKNK